MKHHTDTIPLQKRLEPTKENHWKHNYGAGGRAQGSNYDSQNFAGVANLVRESIQNSTDARLDPTKPTTVVMEYERLDPNDIPYRNDLLDNINALLEFLKRKKQLNKEEDSADNPDEEIHKLNLIQDHLTSDGGIPTLRIEDHNCTGLDFLTQEDCAAMRNCTWHALLTSNNLSYKAQGKGGSHGQGSNTFFENSFTKMFFCESLGYKNCEYLYGGTAKLVSVSIPKFHSEEPVEIIHHDPDYFFGQGKYGKAPFINKPHTGLFKGRTSGDYGTSIIITGFNRPEGFLTSDTRDKTPLFYEFVAEIIVNFRRAIKEGKLIVVLKQAGEELIRLDSAENAAEFIKTHCYSEESWAALWGPDQETDEMKKRIESLRQDLLIDEKYFRGGTITIPIPKSSEDGNWGEMQVILGTTKKHFEATRTNGIRVSKPWLNSSPLPEPHALIVDITDPVANQELRRLENNTHTSWMDKDREKMTDPKIKHAVKVRRQISMDSRKALNRHFILDTTGDDLYISVPTNGFSKEEPFTFTAQSKVTGLQQHSSSVITQRTSNMEPLGTIHPPRQKRNDGKSSSNKKRMSSPKSTPRKRRSPKKVNEPLEYTIFQVNPQLGEHAIVLHTTEPINYAVLSCAYEENPENSKDNWREKRQMKFTRAAALFGASASISDDGELIISNATSNTVHISVTTEKTGPASLSLRLKHE